MLEYWNFAKKYKGGLYMINFDQRQVNGMSSLRFNMGENTEARLLKYSSDGKYKLIKRFYHDSGDIFQNKIQTINELIDNSQRFDERFILPLDFATVDYRVVGYVMNYVQNENLGNLLTSYNVSDYQKKELLKEVGYILSYCKNLRNKYEELSQFYIGDLQERNFIYSKETGRITAIDLDSCRIGYNEPFESKYLVTSKGIKGMLKYPVNGEGVNIPNENSDLYCYSIMILNYIYGGMTQLMSKEEFFEYLNYLNSIGFDKELLSMFSKLYSNDDNVNPQPFIDTINEILLPSANKAVYRKKILGKRK